MIDKTLWVATGIGAVSGLIAQTTPDLPGNPWANLTEKGALIFVLIWMTTRTLPSIVKDFRDELALVRADRDKERDRVTCQGRQNQEPPPHQ